MEMLVKLMSGNLGVKQIIMGDRYDMTLKYVCLEFENTNCS